MKRENQQTDIWHLAGEAAAEYDAVKLGHRNIEHCDVWPSLADQLESAKAADGFTNELEVILCADKIAQPVEHNGVVVGKDDTGFLGHAADLCASSTMRANNAVPVPGVDSISSVPPMSNRRSRIPSKPRP